MCTNIVFALFLSFTAYLCDLQKQKIPNALIMMGYATGFMYVIFEKGPPGIPEAVISLAWPILLLYVLFRMQALGAGDIKLLSVISVFLGFHQMLFIIYMSFVVGALAGLIRMIKNKEADAFLKNISFYMQSAVAEKRIVAYQREYSIGVLHFAGCIFAAVAMVFVWEDIICHGTFQAFGV